MIPKPLLSALIVLIALAWFANLTIGWVDPARSIPAVNTIFGIVTGALFTLGRKDTALTKIKSVQAKRARPKQQDDDGDQS